MKNQKALDKNQPPSEDEIELRLVLDFFLRNKILIGFFSFSFFIIAYLYSLTLKKVWEGQFQIVLNAQDSSLSSINPFLQRFVSQKKGNDLSTQVGILKSPSVLMPIFNYVNLQKNINQNDPQTSFLKWEKQLNIELEDQTSILNISYQDVDKELIIPTLKKMSSIYQKYSGAKVKREQQLTTDYLLNQIGIYKKKSFDSLKKVQEFAIDQDLMFFEGGAKTISSNTNNLKNFSSNIDIGSQDKMILPNIEIESARVRAANQIRNIDSQIKKIKQTDDFEEIQYITSTIPTLVEEGLPSRLANINSQIIAKRRLFKDEDIAIQNLLEQRDTLIVISIERALGHLRANRIQAKAMLDATSRPKGILIKYKELIRNASRDENTLILLEDRLRDIKLESAKRSDPWELISKPILLKNPVAPSKRNISFIGLIVGVLFGSSIALLREKNLIFKKN